MQKRPIGDKLFKHQQDIKVPHKIPDIKGLTLENYCDHKHGYMAFTVDKKKISGVFYGCHYKQHKKRKMELRKKKLDGFMTDINWG